MKPMRILLAIFLTLFLVTSNAFAWQRLKATTFAKLPDGFIQPEGITADVFGNLYVGSFAPNGSATTGQIAVINRFGRLARVLNVANSSPALLGLAFHPKTHHLLVIDFGAQQVLTVNPFTGESSVFTTIPGGAAAGPNALAFDADGNVYISDSFQGIIWRTGPNGGTPTAWVTSPLLSTTGVPGFGANGLAFNRDESAMFVANTGDDAIVRIAVVAGAPGTPAVLVHGINGADGLMIDRHDNIWVAANQSDEIVVIDPTGRPLAKLGDFDGIGRRGTPRGLLFPASLVRTHGFVYITNLSLDLRAVGGPQTLNSQPGAEVTTYTIARLPAIIPRNH
jgi:DNA-binding beta-propeller fold protein YncE